MTDKADNYNLLVKPWIPILRIHGKPDRVGIRTALIEAGRIRQIAASNPMDNVALLRFLLAVLQWCKPTGARKSRPGSRTRTSFARPSGNASSRRSARRPKLQTDREEGRCHG
jgi:hypothetical protein